MNCPQPSLWNVEQPAGWRQKKSGAPCDLQSICVVQGEIFRNITWCIRVTGWQFLGTVIQKTIYCGVHVLGTGIREFVRVVCFLRIRRTRFFCWRNESSSVSRRLLRHLSSSRLWDRLSLWIVLLHQGNLDLTVQTLVVTGQTGSSSVGVVMDSYVSDRIFGPYSVCAVAPRRSSSRFWNRSRSILPYSQDVLVTFKGAGFSSLKMHLMIWWSVYSTWCVCHYWTMSSSMREISKSKVWPCLWVEPVMC